MPSQREGLKRTEKRLNKKKSSVSEYSKIIEVQDKRISYIMIQLGEIRKELDLLKLNASNHDRSIRDIYIELRKLKGLKGIYDNVISKDLASMNNEIKNQRDFLNHEIFAFGHHTHPQPGVISVSYCQRLKRNKQIKGGLNEKRFNQSS